MVKYVIYQTFCGIKGTTEENYKAFIQDARKIMNFDGFENLEDAKNYVVKYFGYAPEEVELIP